jgi:hypothetical protein
MAGRGKTLKRLVSFWMYFHRAGSPVLMRPRLVRVKLPAGGGWGAMGLMGLMGLMGPIEYGAFHDSRRFVNVKAGAGSSGCSSHVAVRIKV